MNRGLFGTMFVLGVSLACSRPRFTYDIPAKNSQQAQATIALDPRTDIAYFIEGKRQIRDPEVRRLVLSALQAKGYRLVPEGQADVWVNALLLIDNAHAWPAGGGLASGHGGSHGGMHGGHGGGFDQGGDHGTSSSSHQGGGMAVLVELLGRPSLGRIWFGMGEVGPAKGAAGHHSSLPMEDTVSLLLEPLGPPPAVAQSQP